MSACDAAYTDESMRKEGPLPDVRGKRYTRVSASSSQSSGTCGFLSAFPRGTSATTCNAVSRTHLLAVQQHRQVIRHFAPVPNNPRKRVATSSPRTAEVCRAAIAASKHSALPPQLLQLSFIAQFLGRCAWCAWSAAPAARGGAARVDIKVWRWFERFEGWRTHRLNGQQIGGRLAALRRRQRVFGPCGS
jgi:hypothetical protein